MGKRSVCIGLTVVVLLALATVSGSAQSPRYDQAFYVGMDTCYGCHVSLPIGPPRNAFLETRHPWALRPKEEATIVGTFPVTDTHGIVWTLDDVDWVIGAWPRSKQNYIKIIDGVWRILPVQWNVATQEWVPYHPDEWMERDYKDLCAGCHSTGYDVETREWVGPGVTCESCHGPGSEHVATGDKAKIVKTVDAEVCGRCHVGGKTKPGLYHRQYPWPEGVVPGGDVHIEDVFDYDWSDENWWYDEVVDSTAIPGHARSQNQQYMEYQGGDDQPSSAHARSLDDLKASDQAQDYCLRCHSEDYRRDNTLTLETAQFPITCVTCHSTHNITAQVPVQFLLDVYGTCVQCHTGTEGGVRPFQPGTTPRASMQEMFEGWGALNVPDTPSPHYQAANGPHCGHCHFVKTAQSAVPGDITSMRQLVVMPGAAKEGEPDSCTRCHTEFTREAAQTIIDTRQATIRSRVAALAAELETRRALYQDRDAWQIAYTNLTFVTSDRSAGIHNYDYAQTILDDVKNQLDALPSVYRVWLPLTIQDRRSTQPAWPGLSNPGSTVTKSTRMRLVHRTDLAVPLEHKRVSTQKQETSQR